MVVVANTNMGKVRVLDDYSAKQIPNPTGPAMGLRIGTAVKDLGEILAEELSGPPEDKGRVYSHHWRTIRDASEVPLPFRFWYSFIHNLFDESDRRTGATHYADIRFKRHWYFPSKIMLSVLGREWEDSVFIAARCPALLPFIKKAADKFVTRPGVPDVNIYATGPEFLPPRPPPASPAPA